MAKHNLNLCLLVSSSTIAFSFFSFSVGLLRGKGSKDGMELEGDRQSQFGCSMLKSALHLMKSQLFHNFRSFCWGKPTSLQ